MVDRDLLVEYALGTLDPAREAEVEAYLRDHPEAEAEVQADLAGLTRMVMDLDPHEVPAGDADALLARVRADRETSARTPDPARLPDPAPSASTPVAGPPNVRWEASPHPGEAQVSAKRARQLWPGLAVAAALAVVLALSAPGLRDWQATRELDAYRRQPGAVSRTVQARDGEILGTIVRLGDGRAFVRLREAPQRGRVYQAWRVTPEGPVSLGVFDGQRLLTRPLPGETVFAVSVEPPGGSSQPTTTPISVTPL